MNIQLAKLVKSDNNLTQADLVNVTLTDGTTLSIPLEESNRHYHEYLEWLAEGNTPEEAD
jgi:hypothetical protein